MARVIFLMLDGVGVGALPDAAEYGDAGSNTLGNLSQVVRLHLPVLQRLGLGNITPLLGVPPASEPLCLTGRLAPLSAGKDTTVGHWEHMGLVTPQPFPTYPSGFPEEVISAFSRRIGREVLGNRPASGTVIIEELGETHISTGKPIVYTSADSVFQIAAHVDLVPLEQLYTWARIARDLLQGPHAVARVIARPFSGTPGRFVRTKDRRDFSLPPSGPTYLDLLQEAGVPVFALGKIAEIFAGRGISATYKVGSNADNLALVKELVWGNSARPDFAEGLLFTNLVDFDMLWGHRNDVEGFARGLLMVDGALPDILGALDPASDRLIITADHGVDPTTPSTDHSREYVPLLLYPRPVEAPDLNYEGFFSDTGATVYRHLVAKEPPLGGTPLIHLSPARGWRHWTPTQPLPGDSCREVPCRVGRVETETAARWLADTLGPAPEVAIVLGSGQRLEWDRSESEPECEQPIAEVAYEAVPHWRGTAVTGHSGRFRLFERFGRRVAVLAGRIHEYEGYDLSELQLPLRSLAEWGVKKFVLSSTAGAVVPRLTPGDIVFVEKILDLQHFDPGQVPLLVTATRSGHIETLISSGSALRVGVHAAVPGPQYETRAELAALRRLGATTVSMSLAGEIHALVGQDLEAVVLAVIANVGDTSHGEVVDGALAASHKLTAAVHKILAEWPGSSWAVASTPSSKGATSRGMSPA